MARHNPIREPAAMRLPFFSLVLPALLLALPVRAAEGPACVAIGSWLVPGAAAPADLYGGLAHRNVVLLGESHANVEDHRWQLQVIAALLGQRSDLVLGFEMFPRRVQPVLDRWVAGELSQAQFLEASEWRQVWRFDPELYLPIFHFARMNRVKMLALNVDEALVHRISAEGWQSVPPAEREGLADPAPAEPDYVAELRQVFEGHAEQGKEPPPFDAARFQRFVEAQLTWDAAMAQALVAGRKQTATPPLMIGVVGEGHVENRYGIPHQLASLGLDNVAVLLPWGPERDCSELKAGIADAVFGVAAPEAGPKPPRLGVAIAATSGPPRIQSVQSASVAEQAGLKKDDVIIEAAGATLQSYDDLTAIIGRQAPGTWLPLKVKRGDETLSLVAEFPR
jgi:uncharacterized iron-regulated protein